MYIVYYTNKAGKIFSYHKVEDEMTLQELEEAVRIYNQKSKNIQIAHIFDAEDGGITAYLFRKAAELDEIENLKDAWDFTDRLYR